MPNSKVTLEWVEALLPHRNICQQWNKHPWHCFTWTKNTNMHFAFGHPQGWRNLTNVYLSTDKWFHKPTCPYQCTICPYFSKYKCKYVNINDLMNARSLLSHKSNHNFTTIFILNISYSFRFCNEILISL